ncbi:MAG: 2-amino-4-hydroxy-6-hydroxymethyldihydropteridine diphosphokinase [Nitrospirae bacterium]|nr:2-amino-4-hydroxy-6-hydroxymethyldihydropteridine diphosphokinase [Nitrospirota bacterium]
MTRAFVSLGSNIRPAENIKKALHLLAQKARLIAVSTVYCTAPEGRLEQPSYYNCAAEIETEASPAELKHSVLRHIEGNLGRMRSEDKYAPRTIDLDLILYDDLVLETEDITIPDPEIERRSFLAAALCELAPELRLPGSGIPIRELALRFRGQEMNPLREFTELLRKETIHGPEHEEDDGVGEGTACRDRRGP